MPEVIEPKRSLSKVTASSEGEVSELLAFMCNDEPYAVSLSSVHEIVIPPPITIVPRAPQAVLGVCSVRGELATIVDLRHVLGLPAMRDLGKSRILLARFQQSELVGLRVDEVRHVVRLASSQMMVR
jgi:purine-binding chemotaxis protein CheW